LRLRTSREEKIFFTFAFLVFITWLFFESAAPPSYTVYAVLSLSLMTVIAFGHWFQKPVFGMTFILVLSLWVSRNAISDGLTAMQMGKSLNTTQSEAFSEAVSKLDQKRPRVLVQAPFLNLALKSEHVSPVTSSFIDYPGSYKSTIGTLKQHNVRYLMLVASPLNTNYMREVQPLRSVAERYGSLVYQREVPMTDIMRNYFDPDLSQADTLMLFKIDR
jgi:hypothetical protein